MDEVRAGIAGYAACIYPVIFPVLARNEVSGTFFYLSVEIPGAVVPEDAGAVGVDRMTVCVQPWVVRCVRQQPCPMIIAEYIIRAFRTFDQAIRGNKSVVMEIKAA